MIERSVTEKIEQALRQFPVVALIGPRQVGKTTLAKWLEARQAKPTLFLDLERHSDRQRLAEPELFLSQMLDRCVIMDEVQQMPQLFPLLRWLVDQRREPARYLITGPATPALLQQTTESLAGRIAYFEITPLGLLEVLPQVTLQQHWFRGGFPLSLLAASDGDSRVWLDNFIDTYLQRDMRNLGYDISVATMGRLLQVLASLHGQVLTLSDVSNNLNISTKTLNKYLDILEGSLLIRRLSPFFANTTKRLVRSPKLYFRDTGLLHRLLQINNMEHLHGSIFLGNSWEGYVLEQIAQRVGNDWQLDFYRTHAGAEVDLMLSQPGSKRILIEIKYSTDPTPSRGFYETATELSPTAQFILIPEGETWFRNATQQVCGLEHFLRHVLPLLSA